MIPSRHSGSLCPACSRYLDRAAQCPFCGAENRLHLALFTLRCAAGIFSMGGLLLLFIL